MTSSPLLHPATEKEVKQLIAAPRHAVLIKGAEGSGKYFTALHIAASILGIESHKLHLQAYYYEYAPVKDSISIDSIRSLISKAQLKTTGKSPLRRIMLIRDAHYMTREAQNAFLKLLEEPPDDTVILLTSSRPSALLPTIHSRVSTVHVKPLKQEALRSHFGSGADAEFSAYYHMSDGTIGTMHSLYNNDSTKNTDSINLAKRAITEPSPNKFGLVEEIIKSSADDFAAALIVLARAGLKTARSQAQAKRWSGILTAAFNTQVSLKNRAHPKLAITQLMTEL